MNVFNVHLGPNVTEHLPMIQYYFSQPSTVSLFKAPTSKLFESQSSWTWSKTYSDFAVNKTTALSQFMRDFLNVKQWFISGDNDYIAYKQSLRIWLENELTFVESATFKPLKLEVIINVIFRTLFLMARPLDTPRELSKSDIHNLLTVAIT